MALDIEKEAIRRIMGKLGSPCIVELGARTGEDEHWIRGACGEDPNYIMVEPDMQNAQRILEMPRHLGRNRTLILGAVADYDGEITFWPSHNPDGSRTSGSIRIPSGHVTIYPSTSFDDTPTKVPCFMLDTIFKKEWLTKIDLLWVDIQGGEANMICGGRHSLDRTRFLFMEVEWVELYAGQALRPALLNMLPGWKMLEDFGQNILLENPNMIEGRL